MTKERFWIAFTVCQNSQLTLLPFVTAERDGYDQWRTNQAIPKRIKKQARRNCRQAAVNILLKLNQLRIVPQTPIRHSALAVANTRRALMPNPNFGIACGKLPMIADWHQIRVHC
jgi:hypothetical protein